ncbi:hypothetical protein DF186_23890, partial [Enterococcus hirae]
LKTLLIQTFNKFLYFIITQIKLKYTNNTHQQKIFINNQIKLNYIEKHLHNINPAFPTFDKLFKKKNEIKVNNTIKLKD